MLALKYNIIRLFHDYAQISKRKCKYVYLIKIYYNMNLVLVE